MDKVDQIRVLNDLQQDVTRTQIRVQILSELVEKVTLDLNLLGEAISVALQELEE